MVRQSLFKKTARYNKQATYLHCMVSWLLEEEASGTECGRKELRGAL
jgi:hypothetical protein